MTKRPRDDEFDDTEKTVSDTTIVTGSVDVSQRVFDDPRRLTVFIPKTKSTMMDRFIHRKGTVDGPALKLRAKRITVWRSSMRIEDRGSIFRAFGARAPTDGTFDASDVQLVVRYLRSDAEVAKAAHLCHVSMVRGGGCVGEDDGEAFAGERMVGVARRSWRQQTSGDVAVFVARWFGGTLLGPARFRHFEEATASMLKDLASVEDPPAVDPQQASLVLRETQQPPTWRKQSPTIEVIEIE